MPLFSFVAPFALILSAYGSGFPNPLTYRTGGTPAAAVVVDFNHDGFPDIATANQRDLNVSILLANADGTFTQARNYPIAGYPEDIASGDLDGDGNPDLAISEELGTIDIMLGRADGTFVLSPQIYVGDKLTGIQVGDFNLDGKQDLALCVYKYNLPGQGAVGIFLGNGDGTFQSYVPYFAGQNPYYLVATDLNNDGILDLAVSDQDMRGTHKNLAILLGNGDGSFPAPLLSRVAARRGKGITAGDINGDGIVDLATSADDKVFALLGHGDGNFTMSAGFDTSDYFLRLTLGDVDGDGKVDLIAPPGACFLRRNGRLPQTHVYRGNGDGKFGNQLANNFGCSFAAVSDFNRDGIPDLLAGGLNGVRVALGAAQHTSDH